MTDASKFDETTLPEKSVFFHKLKNEHISDSDYLHAKNVWESFNIQNLGQFHDLYLLSDVLLLPSVFEFGWLVVLGFETIFQSISGHLPERRRKRRKDR